MSASRFLATYLAVFLAELPDKTMVATLILTATHRRPLAVWAGAAGAFTVHTTLAVTIGGLLSRLPDRPVAAAVALLFATGAVVLWRQRDEPVELDEAPGAGPASEPDSGARPRRSPFPTAAGSAFAVLLVAEIGDLTQLTMASMATGGALIAVALGGLLALWTVSAMAATAGAALLRVVPVRAVRTAAAAVFAVLAVVSVTRALG
jgi:putative Ca2+/H+ antiporter (TMEM165/GDT1 family)